MGVAGAQLDGQCAPGSGEMRGKTDSIVTVASCAGSPDSNNNNNNSDSRKARDLCIHSARPDSPQPEQQQQSVSNHHQCGVQTPLSSGFLLRTGDP